MDDCATLDVIDGQYNVTSDSDEEQGEMWGRCFPIGKGFKPQGNFKTPHVIRLSGMSNEKIS